MKINLIEVCLVLVASGAMLYPQRFARVYLVIKESE